MSHVSRSGDPVKFKSVGRFSLGTFFFDNFVWAGMKCSCKWTQKKWLISIQQRITCANLLANDDNFLVRFRWHHISISRQNRVHVRQWFRVNDIDAIFGEFFLQFRVEICHFFFHKNTFQLIRNQRKQRKAVYEIQNVKRKCASKRSQLHMTLVFPYGVRTLLLIILLMFCEQNSSRRATLDTISWFI